jgi:hypothetical protein
VNGEQKEEIQREAFGRAFVALNATKGVTTENAEIYYMLAAFMAGRKLTTLGWGLSRRNVYESIPEQVLQQCRNYVPQTMFVMGRQYNHPFKGKPQMGMFGNGGNGNNNGRIYIF